MPALLLLLSLLRIQTNAADGPLTGAKEEWAVSLGAAAAGPPVHVGPVESTTAIAVALVNGKIALYGPDGHRLREMSLDLAPGSAPVSDGTRIYAADVWGAVYCFSNDGQRLWKYPRQDRYGSGYNNLVLADTDGDGAKEILVATQRGNLFALDARGRLRFELNVTNFRISTPAVGDLNHDGLPEIVFANDDGEVYCVNGKGEILWVYREPNGRFGRTLPLIADADNDGRYEVYVGTPSLGQPEGIYAIDALTGKRLWRAKSQLQTYDSIVAVDIDGDGRKEIFFGDKNTRLFAVNAKGEPLWDRQLDGAGIFFGAAVANLDGSGPLLFQIVRRVGTNGKSIYALNGKGDVVDAAPLDRSAPSDGAHSPLLCRFAGSRDIKLVAVTAGGKMICYRPPQTPSAKILWPGARNDTALSGFVPSTAKTQASAQRRVLAVREPAATIHPALSGRNTIDVPAPPDSSMASVRVIDPDGSVHLTFLRSGDGMKASFTATAAGAYRATMQWIEVESGKATRTEHATYTLDAAHSEDARLLRAFETTVAASKKNLGEHAPLAGYFLSLARAFGEEKREERAYWQSLLRYIERVRPAQNLRVEQLDNPWVELDALRVLDNASAGSGNQVRVSMLGNEYESAAVALLNFTPRSVTVRIQTELFTNESGAKVVPHQVLELRDVPHIRRVASGIVSEDVLPLLGEGNTLRLEAGETIKVWLTFRSRNLTAGTWRSRLLIGDLASVDPPLEVPINVAVNSLRLPEQQTYRHNNWLYLDAIADPLVLDATLADATGHGTNTFVIPAVSFSVAADGTLGAMDAVRHDRLVHRLRNVEKSRGPIFFMVSGTVGLRWSKDAAPTPQVKDRAFTEGIRRYVAHMRSLGVSKTSWAFYVRDEPGLSGKDAVFDQWIADVQRVKAADPNAQIYSNPAGGATAAMLQPVQDLVTVWQPDLHLYRDDPENLGAVFRHGQFWHYEAPGEQRELDPLGYYRMKPWVSFQTGMTGGGYWVYSHAPFWFFDRTMAVEYGSVYTTEKGPVTTKRWEASRDGIEDFELLALLRKTATSAGEAGRPALRLMDEAVQWVTKGQEQASDIGRKLHPYTPNYEEWMTYRERLIAALKALPQR